MRFISTGKQVIKSAEFLDDYVIWLENGALCAVNITDQSAANIANYLIYQHDPATGHIILNIGTLNEGDNFTVQMIVDS